jgi:hypothetical protein
LRNQKAAYPLTAFIAFYHPCGANYSVGMPIKLRKDCLL